MEMTKEETMAFTTFIMEVSNDYDTEYANWLIAEILRQLTDENYIQELN